MNNIFFQTYPSTSFKNAVKRDIAFSSFLALFLFVFRPFGLHVYALDRSYVFLGYSLVTLVTTVTNDYLIIIIFKKWYNKSKFRVYHQVLLALWHFLCLGVTNFFFAIYLDAFPINMLSFFKIQLYVILSAFVPITIYILLKQNYLLKRNLSEAKEIQVELSNSKKNNPFDDKSLIVETPILFYAENLKESLSIVPSKLLYLISQDNYVEFFWCENCKIHKRLLRNTLSYYEKQLNGDNRFFRCHRAYIVNLTKIESVSGNSQGYLIVMNGVEDSIPVSRSKAKDLKIALHSEILDFHT